MMRLGRRLHINWKLALFTLIMLPILLRLGFWQLSREDEKLAMQVRYESRVAAVPISVAEAAAEEDSGYMAVALQGRYDNQHYFLLDNRTYEGRPGFEVISPLQLEEGGTVLVNRGWIAQGEYRSELPQAEIVNGAVDLLANVYVPAGRQVMLGEESAFSGWPRLLQRIDVPRMYEELEVAPDAQALDYTLRLQEAEPGVLVRNWQAMNTSPEKHRGYAVQWFSMAVVLLGLFMYSCLRRSKSDKIDH